MRLIPYISLFLFFILFSVSAWSQDSLLNRNLENWVYDAGGDYYEPVAPWATVNTASKLGPAAPVTTFREEVKVHSGQYAAKMVSGVFLLLPVAGILALGEFDNTVTDPSQALKLGMPFTDRPTRFQGYYQYYPVDGDSAAIVCQLFRHNGTSSEMIGQAAEFVYDSITSYAFFDFEMEYTSTDAPDTIEIVFTSSAGGSNFLAASGSTLYIDDVSLVYGSNLVMPLMPEFGIRHYPNPATDQLYFEFEGNYQGLSVGIFDMSGRKWLEKPLEEEVGIPIGALPEGMYFYQVMKDGQVVSGGKFDHIR